MHQFKIQLADYDFNEDLADGIYVAGCSDALLHSDSSGIYLDFCRKAPNLELAVTSALQNLSNGGFKIKRIYYYE